MTDLPSRADLGDYSGVEFDLAVEGSRRRSRTARAPRSASTPSRPSCTRWYNSSVAQRETYRVLDLDGERAILAFGEFDDKTQPALVEEAQGVFDSITFVVGVTGRITRCTTDAAARPASDVSG